MVKNRDKIRIFSQDQINKFEPNGKMEKKDRKNVVKNLVKIFLSWIEKKKKDDSSERFEEV